MILDSARDLHQLTATLKDRKRAYESSVVWATHAGTLRELTLAIRTPAGFLAWMATTNHRAVSAENAAVGQATTAVRTLIEGLNKDPDRVLRGDLIGKARRAVEEAGSRLREAAEAEWGSYVAGLPPTDADLYVGFRTHADLADLVQQAAAQDRRYTELRKLPYLDTPSLRTEFVQLLQDRAQTRAALPNITDEEIRAFVAAASGDGAALQALTPAVLAWLDENGLTGAYTVHKARGH